MPGYGAGRKVCPEAPREWLSNPARYAGYNTRHMGFGPACTSKRPIRMANKAETLKIEGMSCGHCVGAVRRALEEIEGVAVQAVEIGTAQISYDPEEVDPTRLVEAVEEAGYTVLETA